MKVVKEESWSPGLSLPLPRPWPVPPPPTSLNFSTQDLPPFVSTEGACTSFPMWKEVFLPWGMALSSWFNYWMFVQLLNRARLLWTAVLQVPLSSTVSGSLLRFTSFESVMLSNHLIPCCSLFLLPSILPYQGFFFFFSQWVSSSHQVAKVLVLQHQRQSFQWIFRVNFL